MYTTHITNHFLPPHTAVVAAVAPAIMLNTASGLLIDNAWAVMVERSIKAGKLLAHTLMTVCVEVLCDDGDGCWLVCVCKGGRVGV